MPARKQMLSILVAFVTPSILYAKAVPCPADSVGIAYHDLDGSHIALSVSINHSGPYEFMVDTGAQLTLIDPQLATKLKLDPRGSVGLIAVLKRSSVDLVKAELVEAGPAAVSELTMAIVGLKQIQAENPRVRGILGENFLGRFDLLIDYGHKMVCMDQSKELQKHLQGEHVPLIGEQIGDGEMAFTSPVLVRVHMEGDDKKITVLNLDSGSNVPILYENPLGTPWWTQRDDACRGSTAGKGGALSFATLPNQTVKIGSHMTREISFLTPIGPEPPKAIAGEDGLLPTALFKRVFISLADGFVIFDPR